MGWCTTTHCSCYPRLFWCRTRLATWNELTTTRAGQPVQYSPSSSYSHASSDSSSCTQPSYAPSTTHHSQRQSLAVSKIFSSLIWVRILTMQIFCFMIMTIVVSSSNESVSFKWELPILPLFFRQKRGNRERMGASWQLSLEWKNLIWIEHYCTALEIFWDIAEGLW